MIRLGRQRHTAGLLGGIVAVPRVLRELMRCRAHRAQWLRSSGTARVDKVPRTPAKLGHLPWVLQELIRCCGHRYLRADPPTMVDSVDEGIGVLLCDLGITALCLGMVVAFVADAERIERCAC